MKDKDLTRKYRIQQWAKAIQDQKSSGMSIDQWCTAHNVSRDQFFYRQRVVKKALASDLEAHLQEKAALPLVTESSAPTDRNPEHSISFAQVPAAVLTGKHGGVALRLQYGRSTIEISNEASDRILSMLCEVILHAE